MLWSGEQVWGWRARESLKRGGDSLEGASSPRARQSLTRGATSPRARRSLTRGGVQPSSEAEPHPRGWPALERGGVSLVLLCPSSEAEFRPRVAGADCFGGPLRPPGPWAPATEPVIVLGVFYACEFICVLFFAKENGFSPGFLGDPYGCP
jgi:hypothetical protein